MNTAKLYGLYVELKEFTEDSDIKIEDKEILHEAIKIYMHENISDEKKQESTKKQETDKKQEKASLKQINYLKALGYNGDPKALTSLEANLIIKELKKSEDY